MSSTKNTKDNRQVVWATYHAPESLFEIPDGLDLEDKTVVEDWWVKCDQLHIKYVTGDKISLPPYSSAMQDCEDYTYPNECEIVSADEVGHEYDEDDPECDECGSDENTEQCSECDKEFCPNHGPHYADTTDPDDIYCNDCAVKKLAEEEEEASAWNKSFGLADDEDGIVEQFNYNWIPSK